MKKTTFLLLFVIAQTLGSAQTNGNKNIITETFPLEKINEIEINLSADITIDFQGKEEITITTDSNLMPFIDHTVINGSMNLTQKKWISASKGHKISIGAPALRKLISDAHSNTYLKNMAVEDFKLIANVGTITMLGTAQNLVIKNNVATVKAAELIAQDAEIRITGWGGVTANVVNKLTSFVTEDSKLEIVNTPKDLSGDSRQAIAQTKENTKANEGVRFIDFKIKNNSWNRRQFVVVGPKPDGGTFSYGFPLNPGQVRKERWTTGTKIYKKNTMGGRKLIVTIKAEDEDQVVKLFD